jgi:hypothetical protein
MVIPQAVHAAQAPVLPPANAPADGKRESGFRPRLRPADVQGLTARADPPPSACSGRGMLLPSQRSADLDKNYFFHAAPVDGEISAF